MVWSSVNSLGLNRATTSPVKLARSALLVLDGQFRLSTPESCPRPELPGLAGW